MSEQKKEKEKENEKLEVKRFFIHTQPHLIPEGRGYATGLEIETVDGRRFLQIETNRLGWTELK